LVEKSILEKPRTHMPMDVHMRAPKMAYEIPGFNVATTPKVSESRRSPVRFQSRYSSLPPAGREHVLDGMMHEEDVDSGNIRYAGRC